MTASALVFMLTVWTFVFGMVAYCYTRMLRSKRGLTLDEHEDKTDQPQDNLNE